MAERYDVQAIMDDLKQREEMDPYHHDASYEMMHETIAAYSNLSDFDALDYRDLNLVYLTTVGTWKHGIEAKIKTINESHLLPDDKEYLTMLWNEVWDKAHNGEYANSTWEKEGRITIGMFGTGFFSFQKKTTSEDTQAFIGMCVDMLPMSDDYEMFDRAASVLTASFRGMASASASMVLHCLKPFTFPILNSIMGNSDVYTILGVPLVRKGSLDTYIDNCRKVKAFRDKNFTFKNYRIFDLAALDMSKYVLEPCGSSTEDGPSQSESEDEWWPTEEEYSPELTTEQWLALLADKEVFFDSSLAIVKRIKDYGGAATCTQLAIKYGKSKNYYLTNSIYLAQRIARKTGCPVRTEESGKSHWWSILYVGKSVDQNMGQGVFIWKLRKELSDALDQFDLSDVPLYAEKDNQDALEPMDAEITETEIMEPEIEIPVVDPYDKAAFLNDVFMSSERYDTLVALLMHRKNVILQGAPGVGKTFAAKRLSWSMMGEKDESRIQFVQFHQNYAYEDFIMGYKPDGNGFKLTEGIFYEFCQRAGQDRNRVYFFIIDEINRGNLSKIFGELLMLIEKDYRGTPATLAYTRKPFTVPENIYIIGMMNTADRSLAMIDYALRRRFSFYDMEPGFDTEGFQAYQKGLDNETFDQLIECVRELNRAILKDPVLGAGFRIGHSYFCNQQECTDEWMKAVVYYDILPTLREYWFDDPEKLRQWENRLSGVFDD